MSEQRLSNLQKWILTNCYKQEINEKPYTNHYKHAEQQKKKYNENYILDRIQIFRYFGFKVYYRYGRDKYGRDTYNYSDRLILPEKPDNFCLDYGVPKDFEEIKKERNDGIKLMQKASVSITRTIENLFSKGYIDAKNHFDWIFEDAKNKLKKHRESLRNVVKTGEPEKLNPLLDNEEIVLDKDFFIDMIRDWKEFINKPFITRGFGNHVIQIKLTEKGIEKARELSGGDSNN